MAQNYFDAGEEYEYPVDTNLYSIYGLADPRDKVVRYVGLSKDPDQRLKGHLAKAPANRGKDEKEKWLHELSQLSLVPFLLILDKAKDLEEAREKEKHWMTFYQSTVELTNTRLPKEKFKPKIEQGKKRQRLPLPRISEQTKSIAAKLEVDRSGSTLSDDDLDFEVSSAEASVLLSIIAGREIKKSYISQLTRDDDTHPRRLEASSAVGAAYRYKVKSLLKIKFNRKGAGDNERRSQDTTQVHEPGTDQISHP